MAKRRSLNIKKLNIFMMRDSTKSTNREESSGADSSQHFQSGDVSDVADTDSEDGLCEDNNNGKDAFADISKLSTENIGIILHLLRTMSTEKETRFYFKLHPNTQEKFIRNILYNTSMFIKNECCNLCGKDKIKCGCVDAELVELYMSDVGLLLRSFDIMFRDEVKKVQDNVRSCINTTTSPMQCAQLRELLRKDPKGPVTYHFLVNFDGVQIKNSSKKVWFLGMHLLDLEDHSRSTIRATTTVGIFVGLVQPSMVIHDRLAKWLQGRLGNGTSSARGQIIIASYDDPAMRIVYGYKGHSASGACENCHAQDVVQKVSLDPYWPRADTNFRVPSLFQDGLKEPGVYGWFATNINASWRNPLDVLHVFHEGCLKRLNDETSGVTVKLQFRLPTTTLLTPQEVPLPTKMQITGRKKVSTGSENALIFATITLFAAMSCDLSLSGCITVMLTNSLYQLQVQPLDSRLSVVDKVVNLSAVFQEFVRDHLPAFVNGPKAHNIHAHIAEKVIALGPMGPYSTQSFEHQFGVAQRLLCRETTRNFAFEIFKRSSVSAMLSAEISRRMRQDGDDDDNNSLVHDIAMTLRLPDNLGTSFDNETDDGVNVLETPEWVSDLFSNSTLIDSNAHMELKGFCKNVVHYSIPVLGIRYLDTIALIHNIIFLFYLFWKWGVLGRQLRRGKSAVFTAFMLLVYFCIFANTANVVYNVTVTVAKVRLNEFYETIIWSCTKFIHLVIEYSVIFFSFLFGRLDSAKCVVHAFLWSVVIAGLQTGLQYAFQTELIDDEWILQFIDLDGNIGFTIASFLMMIGMYLFVALVHVSCCGKSIDLPRPFYFAWFCILMISVNVVQAVGAAMVLLNLQEGYCFSNASVMFYSCYYAPLVFSTFLKNCYKRPRNNESNGAFMYRKQKDEIGELRDSYFPRFSGLTSPSYDDLFDYGRDARYTHYDLATGEYLPNPYSIPLIMSSAETAESTVTTRTGSDEMVANRDSVLFEGTSVRQLKGLGPQGSLIFEEPRHSWYYQ